MTTLMLLLQGCPGSIDDPQAFLDGRNMTDSGKPDASTDDATTGDASEGCDVSAIFNDSETGCAGASCHAGGGPTAPLLEMSNWENLNTSSLFCPDTPYVSPGDPSNSAVYLKLLPDGMRGTCTGARMPSSRPPLSDADIECVRSWIEGM